MNDNTLEVIAGKTEKVQTRKGEIVVRELVLEDVPPLTEVFIGLFTELPSDAIKNPSEMKVAIGMLFKSKALIEGVKKILCQVTDKPEGFFDNFPVIDLLKLVHAFFKVNDIGEVKNLFFELQSMFSKKEVPKK